MWIKTTTRIFLTYSNRLLRKLCVVKRTCSLVFRAINNGKKLLFHVHERLFLANCKKVATFLQLAIIWSDFFRED